MIRTLFFITLGGSITLFILGTSTNSEIFIPWLVGFAIATAVLLTLWIFGRVLQNSVISRADLEDARNSGRIRAAMIVSRRQTGLFVNEQPQVEFTLLVDRPEASPYLTKARKIVSLLDVHDITVGSLMTVAQPSAEYGDVVIVEEPTPAPSSGLSLAAASTAIELPRRSATGAGGRGLLKVSVFGMAFLIGAIGAPYLATPKAHEYAQLLVDGGAGDYDAIEAIDHVGIFDPAELQTSLDALVDELGHDDMMELMIRPVQLIADAPSAPGATTSDEVTIEDHKVANREPSFMQDLHEIRPLFRIADVDFDAILAGVDDAEQIAIARGASNPELVRITVTREDTGMGDISATLYFEHQHGDEMVSLDAHGQLLPEEHLSLLTEEEQDTYLYDAARAQQAVADMAAAAESNRAVEITNHGGHMGIEAYYGAGEYAGTTARVTFNFGAVNDVDDPRAVDVDAAEVFNVDDVDWNMIIAAIPQAQQIMADGGAPDTQVSHISVDARGAPLADTNDLTARIYLSNEIGRGGSVQFYVKDGSVAHVQGP